VTAFRIIHLDLISPIRPLYALPEVTLDAEDRIIDRHSGGVKLRAKSAAGLFAEVYELQAARDKAILIESERNAQGVRHIPAR
jgi:hypothetical protein